MSKGNICSCIICKSKIFTNSISRHNKKCKRGDVELVKRTNLKCEFCCLEFKQVRSTSRHQRYCKKNPNRINGHKTNQYIKAKNLNLPIPECSLETRIILRNKNLGKNSWWHRRSDSEEKRKNHSNIMLNAVQNNPESYSTRHNPKFKNINGLNFDSSWEVLFYDWCIHEELKCDRCQEFFPYIWENKQRNYFPDFFLPELNLYIEIKGYEKLQDLAKWSYFKNTLVILRGNEIAKIKNNEFSINDLSTFIFTLPLV